MSLKRSDAVKAIAVVEKFLKAGHFPIGRPPGRNAKKPAIRATAEKLGVPFSTLRDRLGTPKVAGFWWRAFGLKPNWKLYVEPEKSKFVQDDIENNPVEKLHVRDQLNQTRRELDEARRATRIQDSFQRSLLGLSKNMPVPRVFATPAHGPQIAETIVLMANDWQWGETVSLDRMDGINSFNVGIARKRAEKLFAAAVDLATKHWSGPPPARLILIIGGDMISGEIHEELAKTNELQAIPALKDCAGALMGGIDLLRKSLQCPIDIIVIPGNHGRVTRKPESKLYVETSYDTLLGDILDLHYRADKSITFYAPASGDALFSVEGWSVLATHGDRIGSRGGMGFVGAAATVARGFKRLIGDYAARSVILDVILCGHFHVPLRLEEGYVSGTLVGPSEYARDGRFRPHPASQLFLTIHPRRGVTQVREIQVGSHDEGTIYQGRSPSVQRPRYRVAAIGKKAA